jgi:hypothetical protein
MRLGFLSSFPIFESLVNHSTNILCHLKTGTQLTMWLCNVLIRISFEPISTQYFMISRCANTVHVVDFAILRKEV